MYCRIKNFKLAIALDDMHPGIIKMVRERTEKPKASFFIPPDLTLRWVERYGQEQEAVREVSLTLPGAWLEGVEDARGVLLKFRNPMDARDFADKVEAGKLKDCDLIASVECVEIDE